MILGGGVAGLSAAAELRGAGHDVLLVEARARLGGRVFTFRDRAHAAGTAVELGAEFLHEGSELLVQLARRHHLRVCEVEGTSWIADPTRVSALHSIDDFDARVSDGLREAFRHVPRRGDRSMAEALALASLPPRTLALTRAFVEGFQAGPADVMSARALSKGGAEGAGRSRRLIDGYDDVVRVLTTILDADVRLGTTVRRVTFRERNVHIAAVGESGHSVEITAKAAIVALPIGVLQLAPGAEGAVEFDPPLRTKLDAFAHVSMSHVTKLTLWFREPFWRSAARVPANQRKALERAAFFFAPNAPFPTFWTSRPIDSPFLVAWAGGPAHDALRQRSPESIVSAALDGFASILGVRRGVVHDAFETSFTHDWQSDPFARGAYSFIRVGGEAGPAALRRPLKRTLFFAGEHTCEPPDNGTVHGALKSGQRAAREVCRALVRSGR